MSGAIRSLFLAVLPPSIAQRLQFRLKEPSRQRSASSTGDKELDAMLAEIDREGFAVIKDYLSPEQCEAGIREFEKARRTYPSYVSKLDDDRIFGIENVSPIADSFFKDSRWLRLANAYMGEANTAMFAMGNAIRWDGAGKLGSGGGWHRDCFSRELKVIVYLSDVGPENGPFQILRRSHSKSAILADMQRAGLKAIQNRLTDDQVSKLIAEDADRQFMITAPAGTAIVFDDSSIHTGRPIQAGMRYALTNYFMATRNFSSSNLDYYEPIIRGDRMPAKITGAPSA